MPRLLKIALLTTGLCAGLLLTLLTARFGWRVCDHLFFRRGCWSSPEKRAAIQAYAARNAVDAFLVGHGRCPRAEAELVTSRHLGRGLTNPWGQQLFYTCLETGDDLIVTVRSAGPDRVFWTADDVVSGED